MWTFAGDYSMPFDYAIHSDLLVYWTGKKDIEPECGTADWHKEGCPKEKRENGQLKNAYLQRLTNILKHGLWMTNQSPPEIGQEYECENAPCTCFTELKLSQSHTHATQYGRLGLGFKRSFVFDRGGRPVIYYGTRSWTKKDPFLQSCANDLKDKRLMHFFKPMNSDNKSLNYDLYSESECVSDRFPIIDPQLPGTPANDYFRELNKIQQSTLRYLIPVDGWLALIIYPSFAIKCAARESNEIRELLKKIKTKQDDDANQVEPGNFPVEMDLDLCRNF
jgi:hypothetical protein